MDMDKNNTIPNCGKGPDLRGKRFVVGTKQLKKALRDSRAVSVYLAENADPALTQPLETLCFHNHIPVTWVRTMAELGQKCGIEVGAAAAAVVRKT